MRVTVFGPTGRTGLALVELLLGAGHVVVAFARDPGKLPVEHEQLIVVQGDVMDRVAVERAVEGSDAVLSVLGSSTRGPKDMLRSVGGSITSAMKKHGVKRAIVLSGAGVAAPGDPSSVGRTIMTSLLRLLYREMLKDSKGYVAAFQDPELEYTIVRVPRLKEGPRTGVYRVGIMKLGPWQTISRADVADFMVSELAEGRHIRKLPMLSY